MWRAKAEASTLTVVIVWALFTLVAGVVLVIFMSLELNGKPSASLFERGVVLAGCLVFGALLALIASVLTAKEIVATPELLAVRWGLIGTRRYERRRIGGVQVLHDGTLRVVLRGRPDLKVRPAAIGHINELEMRRVLPAMYGPTQEDGRFLARACAPEMAERSQARTVFEAKRQSRWSIAYGVASVVVLGALVIWRDEAFRRIGAAMMAYPEIDWLVALVALGAASAGAFVFLGLVDAWIAFGPNQCKSLEVDENGLTMRWRRTETHLAAERVNGVELVRLENVKEPIIYVHVDLKRRWRIRESWFVTERGELAGVLLHRFGEWVR